MRILQVASFYGPSYAFGGPVVAAEGLSRALLDRGHEVTVCCTNQKTLSEDLDVPTGTPVDRDGAVVFYERVGALRYWGYSPELRKRVEKESQSHDIILSHFHYQYASVAASAIGRRSKKPYVVFTHGTLNKHGMRAKSSWLKRSYFELMERANFDGALFVAFHSQEEIRSSLVAGTPAVVPLGVAVRPARTAAAKAAARSANPDLGDRFAFAFVGRLAGEKGLDGLITAFARVAATADVHLLLVGGDHGGDSEHLRAAVDQLAIGSRVTFTGSVSPERRDELLAASDAFVMPSRSEGLSLATLEAMSAGLPVVVTDRIGLWPEIAESGCGLVVPFGSAELDAALHALVDTPEPGRLAMGSLGRDLVQRSYTWDCAVTALMNQIDARLHD